MANFIAGIISLAISLVIFAGVFVTTVKNTNTSTWTATEVVLWGTLTIVGIAGMLYGVLNVFGLA